VSDIWYHGSPYLLTTIREGSTITQDRDLARVFSHKPTIVLIDDDGTIKHSGTLLGYLYRIPEEVAAEDVYPHPRTTMAPGAEWLTRRALRVELVGPVEVRDEERLSDDDIAALQRRAR
jgi:hypothetical protein